MIVGLMLLMVMQALAELAVMYPVNGAFYTYIVRFIDPSWYELSLRYFRSPILTLDAGASQWAGIMQLGGLSSFPSRLRPLVLPSSFGEMT